MNGMAESFEIVNAYISVVGKNNGHLDLLKKCNVWLSSFTESALRDEYKGSRMLATQLDLLDKARYRVCAVRRHCIREVSAVEALAA